MLSSVIKIVFRRLISALALAWLLSACGFVLAQAPLTIEQEPKSYPFTFAAYGDMRTTDPGNHRETDPEVRAVLERQIAREKPDLLFIGGDLVLNGGDANDWAVFDQETRPLRDAGITIFPALGNHDVRGGPHALDYFFQRFPQLQDHRWYSVHYGNCLFLVLDSDVDHKAGSPQGEWLESELKGVTPDIDFVFLVMHHPPITHSSTEMGGHSVREEEKQMPAYLEQHQAKMRARLVVIAGHVHNYERYWQNGVMYLVSGGGGAEPYKVHRDKRDFYNQPGPAYHYCTFQVERGRLRFQMHKLDMAKGQARWSLGDSFELKVK